MAAARARVSLPIFRAKNPSPITERCLRFVRLLTIEKHFYSSASNDIPLLQKLLKAPVSRIKATLDSEFSSESTEFPWADFLTSLNSSAPRKANLVIEWKLEKLGRENEKSHDSYAQLISLCESIKDLPTALLVFSSMEAKGVKPTSSVFNALYRQVYLQGATEAWLQAKMASGFSADAQTYAFLILSCVKSKNFEDAQRYYEEMVSSGLIPNESVFQNMLLMYCKQKNLSRIKEILKFMLKGEYRIDRDMAKKVVDLYQELGLVEELEELLVSLTESDQNSEVLSLFHCSIIRMYADTDRLDDVEYSVGRMLKHGIAFSCSEDVEKVICSYFRREAYDRLELFLERIKDSYKLTRSIYDLLGAGYRRAGLIEKLNILVNEMKVAGFV
ncbi:UNVERIFIED_CONTAM: hypothetical protein Sradi_5599400 [Sesamum radiatum]|uniref:Pentatricopeptide repeat-containing protein n=1 Tax=Sesamum radiatum TaxID=300843 RepID=A0AAW2KY64_SESRA